MVVLLLDTGNRNDNEDLRNKNYIVTCMKLDCLVYIIWFEVVLNRDTMMSSFQGDTHACQMNALDHL